jgi:hypothetical protein
MARPHNAGNIDAITQLCRDAVRVLSYEDILACTVYAPPMLLMAGPAAIVAGDPVINCVLDAILGCAVSRILHRMGHRLLTALPDPPQPLYLSPRLRVPLKLRRTQFLWMLETLVGAAVFSGIVGKRFLSDGTASGLSAGLICCAAGLALYFLPVYLAKLWIRRHDPTLPLMSPTEDVVNTSLPGVRSIFQ